MTREITVQELFMLKTGEAAYSPNEIGEMLDYLGLEWYTPRRIQHAALHYNLSVSPEEAGIQGLNGFSAKNYIPKSKLS